MGDMVKCRTFRAARAWGRAARARDPDCCSRGRESRRGIAAGNRGGESRQGLAAGNRGGESRQGIAAGKRRRINGPHQAKHRLVTHADFDFLGSSAHGGAAAAATRRVAAMPPLPTGRRQCKSSGASHGPRRALTSSNLGSGPTRQAPKRCPGEAAIRVPACRVLPTRDAPLGPTTGPAGPGDSRRQAQVNRLRSTVGGMA